MNTSAARPRCELHLRGNCPHSRQLITGFFELERSGAIQLKVVAHPLAGPATPIVNARVDGRRVVYDMYDGYNYLPDGSFDPQLFDATLDPINFYFKRSYDVERHRNLRNSHKLRPLGLNYDVTSRFNAWHSGTRPFNPARLCMLLARRIAAGTAKFTGVGDSRSLSIEECEYPPVRPAKPMVLFMTRVWDPGPDGARTRMAAQRRELNHFRVGCIKALRAEFGDAFFGGLADDAYARRHYPEYVLPRRSTTQRAFISRVRRSTVCVATTGLHASIGWKVAEYVAASRAIVSEPLRYCLPGGFQSGRNYLEFETPEALVTSVSHLMTDSGACDQMMRANAAYYHGYVRPDALVMNTIRQVIASSEAPVDAPRRRARNSLLHGANASKSIPDSEGANQGACPGPEVEAPGLCHPA